MSPIFQVKTLRLGELFLAHLNSLGWKGEKRRLLSLLSAETEGGRSQPALCHRGHRPALFSGLHFGFILQPLGP